MAQDASELLVEREALLRMSIFKSKSWFGTCSRGGRYLPLTQHEATGLFSLTFPLMLSLETFHLISELFPPSRIHRFGQYVTSLSFLSPHSHYRRGVAVLSCTHLTAAHAPTPLDDNSCDPEPSPNMRRSYSPSSLFPPSGKLLYVLGLG